MTRKLSTLRPKYLLFGLIVLMMLVVIHRDLALIHPTPELTQHYRTIKWWLIPHGITGALALFLGPLQFSKRLRQRFLGWHRFAGRAYVYGVAIAAPLGVYVEYLKEVNGIGSMRLVIATIGFASMWLLATFTGFQMARRRKIQEHRKWMTRSYAVALVFLEVRTVDQSAFLTRMLDWPSRMLESHSISDLWMFILFAPIAAELVLRCDKLLTERASRIERRAASA